MIVTRFGARFSVGITVIVGSILCVNGAAYLFDLLAWGMHNQWGFEGVRGWGFRFLFHALVTAVALALLAPVLLHGHFAKVAMRRDVMMAIIIGIGLYVAGAFLEVYLPQISR